MEGGEEKKRSDIDGRAAIQAPKLFSSSSEGILFQGGGHEPKNTRSALTTRIEGELIEKLNEVKLREAVK